MSKYEILLRVLDNLSNEARVAGFNGHFPEAGDEQAINQGRSRAYVHLFLKVRFGILDARERESYVTDGSSDGGIDGYFIDRDAKTIHFIQSKFRNSAANFEGKRIELNELAAMDINRIAGGEQADQSGNRYNGKIQGLIRQIATVGDISRYKYHVSIIANVGAVSPQVLNALVGGHPVDCIDANRCYDDLIFPLISGTYYSQDDLHILVDLSKKNAGTKISYEVVTDFGPCEITALFVPTIEVAKVMSRYRNSILKFNPRSYLEHAGSSVNAAIRATMTQTANNEFALFNNGITVLSDETNINEKIGQRNKAQLSLRNPQIINGGQTAYTLSRIYEESGEQADTIFREKEVLLKVITIDDANAVTADPEAKQSLIDRISAATNQQTAVSAADRHSLGPEFKELQDKLFSLYGIVLERKRGEFGDGIREGYLKEEEILERNLFLRIHLAVNGQLAMARQKAIFANFQNVRSLIDNTPALDRFFLGLHCYNLLKGPRVDNEAINAAGREVLCRLFAASLRHFPEDLPRRSADAMKLAQPIVAQAKGEWVKFESHISKQEKNYITFSVDNRSGEVRASFDRIKWINSGRIERDMREYFGGSKD